MRHRRQPHGGRSIGEGGIRVTIKEFEQLLGGNRRISTEVSKNSSELRNLSSEVSFHSSELLFQTSEEFGISSGAFGKLLPKNWSLEETVAKVSRGER